MEKNKIKSPLNYTGGKYKLLSQLLPLFPKDISTFVDLFTGGGTVALNVEAKKTYAIDNCYPIIKLLTTLRWLGYSKVVEQVKTLEELYSLNRENKEGYLRLREDYNNNSSDHIKLFALLCHSFNNSIRFNSKGKFNVPFGKRIFNDSIKSNLKKMLDRFNERDICLACCDYKQAFDFLELYEVMDSNSFVYCDPPYLITDANYNNGWDKQEFTNLLILLDQLNEKGIKWGLSEVVFHKGKENDVLKEWMQKYKVHYINSDYSNCNYQTKGSSIEVYVYNY